MKKLLTCFVVVQFSGIFAFAGPPAKQVQESVNRQAELDQQRVVSAIQHIAKKRRSGGSARTMKAAVNSLNRAKAIAKKQRLSEVRAPFNVGDFGRLNRARFDVMQKLGSDRILVLANYSTSSPVIGFGKSGNRITKKSQIVVLDSLGQMNATTGQELSLNGNVWVSETFTYDNTLGASVTVPVIVQLNLGDYLEQEKPDTRSKPKPKTPEEMEAAKAKRAGSLVRLGKQLLPSNPSRAEEYFREAAEISPESSAGIEAKQLLEQ